MKTLTFEVSVTFTDDVKDEQVQEVLNHMNLGIFDLIDKSETGLAPLEGHAVTESYVIRETLTGLKVETHIY